MIHPILKLSRLFTYCPKNAGNISPFAVIIYFVICNFMETIKPNNVVEHHLKKICSLTTFLPLSKFVARLRMCLR